MVDVETNIWGMPLVGKVMFRNPYHPFKRLHAYHIEKKVDMPNMVQRKWRFSFFHVACFFFCSSGVSKHDWTNTETHTHTHYAALFNFCLYQIYLNKAFQCFVYARTRLRVELWWNFLYQAIGRAGNMFRRSCSQTHRGFERNLSFGITSQNELCKDPKATMCWLKTHNLAPYLEDHPRLFPFQMA